LNAAELQSAFIGELAGEDAELKAEIKRLREMILKLAVTLQGLSTALGQVSPNMMPYGVSEFIEDFRSKLASEFPAESQLVKWEVQAAGEKFEIDPQLLQSAWLELFSNAFQYERGEGPISAAARTDKDKLVLTIREPKKAGSELSTANWGHEPIGRVRQGHYGLGLNRVRVILEVHGGELRANYDSGASELISTVTLPVSGGTK
jgi:K+-sensing histidine kinase KdpD